jgi:Protein of unknown function (DUF3789)
MGPTIIRSPEGRWAPLIGQEIATVRLMDQRITLGGHRAGGESVSFTFVATLLLIAGVSLGVVTMAIMTVGSEADKTIP